MVSEDGYASRRDRAEHHEEGDGAVHERYDDNSNVRLRPGSRRTANAHALAQCSSPRTARMSRRRQSRCRRASSADAASVKERRKREIVQALHGPQPRPQPPDEHGRWASTGSPSFDGGALQPVPTPIDLAQATDKLITGLAAVSRTYGGATF